MFRYWNHLLMLAAESHQVIVLRTIKLAMGGPSAIDEAGRILTEKTIATGALPVRTLQGRLSFAMLVAYRRAVRNNLRRLSR